MLGTWLAWLTTAAVVLLVPATAAMWTVSRSPHKAVPRAAERRLRVVAAGTAVGVAAMSVAALLGAGPVAAVTVAVVLCASVLVTASSRHGWAMRGVVVRGLLVTAGASGLLWLAYRAVSFGPSLPLLGLLVALLVVCGLAALRLLPVVDAWVERRAGLAPGAAEERPRAARPHGRPPLRLPGVLAAVGAVVLPAAAVVTIAEVGTDDPTDTRPEAGAEATSGRPSPSEPGPTRGTGPSAPPAATTPPPTSAAPPSPPAEPSPTSGGPTPVTAPSEQAPDRSGTSTAEPAPTESSTPTPADDPSGPGLPTLLPWPSPDEDETKTPGYAKEKSNRPADAPSPGHGQG